ncbi:hypothetical protein [Actinomyces sp.]|uniref:hypothetical protein n=1 Tax=Actinomyces sp. TaxID=29317 RepID=UPI0026DAD039|nr:hypothetical protein [Actinomyces sp.]MDO4900922.1 hypothetical protein [Actinomyces sp.]
MSAPLSPDPASDLPGTTRSFRPGPGFVIVLVGIGIVLLLALVAAAAGAFGASGLSAILGGVALIMVGIGLLALLRVPARSLVVNAPRLRLERNRARLARRRRGGAARGAGGSARPDEANAPLTVPGTDLIIPDSSGRRELTTLDVVTGPLTTALATTGAGRKADELLAGTGVGETLIRVLQLLAGTLGFLLLALGLASILGQVIA